MPCEEFYVDGMSGFVCTRRRRVRNCSVAGCVGKGARLCDFPKVGGTCDKPICLTHARRIGPDRDYCPLHDTKEEGMPDQEQIGALWLKQSGSSSQYPEGRKFFAGYIVVNGVEQRIVIFRNAKKTSENQPDYLILRGQERTR